TEFAERVDRFYWQSVLWNESYFVASCGGVTVSVLRRYIEQQDTPEMGASGASSPVSTRDSHPDAHPSG
ncbi:transposase, partial [Rubidibacter lacunae KORDI 51-2]